MRKTRKVQEAKVQAVSAGHQRALCFLLFFIPVLIIAIAIFSGTAFAGSAPVSGGGGSGADLQGYAKFVGNNTNILVSIFSYVAFIIGVVLGALGINELRRHIENPQAAQLKHALTKLAFGGMFLAFPFMLDIALQTMGGYDFSPFKMLKLQNKYDFNSTGVQVGSISGLIASGSKNGTVLINVACFAAFIMGVWFVLRGLQMLRAHMDNPSGNTPMAESLKRLAVGGALLSLPVIVNVIYETFGAFGGAMANSKWTSTGGTAGGLDGMVVKFISDIANPAYQAIEIFCYIAGILMVLFALQRLVKTAQDGPRGPLGFGTITMFIVSGLLLSFPQLLTTIDRSIFGLGKAQTQVNFPLMSLSGGVDPTQIQNAQNVFSAVLAFMAVIGFLAVVRGLFILKAFADGTQQATMMSVVTHIVAGALAINLGAFINAIQKSLGLTSIPVTFT